MLKVLIVDDEINICKLIQNLIDWNEIGLSCCGIAHSADEAFSIAQQQSPDIVITDIKMTGKDGLDLIKDLKELFPALKCIIISGYKSFDYAYTAIKYGVIDFLLKPINQSELNSVLQKLADEINGAGSSLAIESNSAEFVRKQFLMGAVRQNLTQSMAISKINQEYFYNFIEGEFMVGVICLDKGLSQLNYKSSILTKLEDLFYKVLSPDCADLEVAEYNTNTKLLFLLNYEQEKRTDILKDLERYLKQGANALEPYSILRLTLGLGMPVCEPADFYRSYYLAHQAINSRIMVGLGQIIQGEEINPSGAKADFPDYTGYRPDLRKYAELLKKDLLFRTIDQILAEMQPYFAKYPWAVAKWYRDFWRSFIDIMREVHKDCERIGQYRNTFMSKLDSYSQENEIRKKLFVYIEKVIESCENEYSIMHIKVIQIVNQYISDHYDSKLDLETIAQQVHLSPAYLGILYKKETGINISEYITNIRIEKSKTLLKDVRYNISEVASMVGYKDTRYFSNLFKKMVGVKPSEYKKIVHLTGSRGNLNE